MPKKVWFKFKHQPFYFTLNTVAAIAFGILFYFYYTQGQQIKTQTNQGKALAIESIHLSNRIQNQRRNLTYKNCKDQNDRHKAGFKALNKLLIGTITSPKRRKAAFKVTKPLINALVPFRNCVKVANKVVPKPKVRNA